jgi:hypothetical protein
VILFQKKNHKPQNKKFVISFLHDDPENVFINFYFFDFYFVYLQKKIVKNYFYGKM